MARINVAPEILVNPRFQRLVRKLGGDADKALGLLIRFWWAAQRHWGDNKALIPKDEFDLGDFEHLAEVGLAIVTDAGVKARGADKHFDWYLQRLQTASFAGQKSAEARREKYGTAVPLHARNAPNQNRTTGSEDVRTPPNQTRTTTEPNPNVLALTPVLVPTLDRDIVIAKAITRPTTPPAGELVDIWNSHCSSSLSQVTKVTTKRKQKLLARLREEPDLAYWEQTIKRIAASAFCRGEGTQGWRASLDWLIANDTNHAKVNEGKYDDPGSRTVSLEDRAREIFGDDYEAN